MTQTIDAPALAFITEATLHNLERAIDRRWGAFGTAGCALRFDPSGLARLAQIFGWIQGVARTEPEFAEDAAKQLITQLDRLSTYGGLADEDLKIPAYIICLYDDGSFNSFALNWFRAVSPVDQPQISAERWAPQFDCPYQPQYRYAFCHNGGLNFHGDPTIATVSRYLWSVNT